MILYNFDQNIDNKTQLVLTIKTIVGCIGIFFSFMKRKHLELLALIGLIVPLTIVIVYFCFANALVQTQQYNEISYFKLFDNDGNFNEKIFCSSGKFLYIFNIQYFFLGHLKFLKHKGQSVQAKALIRSFYAPLFVTITICWIGYLSYGKNVPKILLQRQNHIESSCFQFFLTILRLALFLNVSVNCGMLLKINIDTLCQLFQSEHEKNMINMNFFKEPLENNLDYLKKWKRLSIYTLSLFLPQIPAFFIKSDTNIQIINIAVSTFSIYYCVFIPIKLNFERKKKLKIRKCEQILLIFYGIILSLFLVLAISNSIKTLIKKQNNQFSLKHNQQQINLLVMEKHEQRKREYIDYLKDLFNKQNIVTKIGYGSGFIWQHGLEKQKKVPMMDVLIVVKNLEKFYNDFQKSLPKHSGFFSQTLNPIIQNNFFPLMYLTQIEDQGFLQKFGVIHEKKFFEDLNQWRYFSLAGRLQKPIQILYQDEESKQQINETQYITQEKDPKKIYENLIGLSYRGDIRNSFSVEPADKIQIIYKAQKELLQEEYKNYKLYDKYSDIENEMKKSDVILFQKMDFSQDLNKNQIKLQENLAKLNKQSSLKLVINQFLGQPLTKNYKYMVQKVFKKQLIQKIKM